MPLLLLSLLGLGGCAGMVSQPGGGAPVVDGRDGGSSSPQEQTAAVVPMEPSQPDNRIMSPSQSSAKIENSLPATSPAVASLLANAEREIKAGRHDYAVASIERALRVEPHSALLWSRLASVRLAQRNWSQANVLAARSNSFARNDRNLQLQNWRIIAQAKAMLGDSAGAASARQMILRLGGNDG